VGTLEKYLSKLHPDNPNMWQRPKNRILEGVDVWYDNSPIGKNTLYNFMANVSRRAGLSVRYTNHCIRATCITTLYHKGVEARHIMGISGHKSENSIRSYSERLSEDKKRHISDILSENVMSTKSFKTDQGAGATIPKEKPSTSLHDINTSENLPVLPLPDFLDDEFSNILADISAYELNQGNANAFNVPQTDSRSGTFNFQHCTVNFNIR
jgi:hypothetical protein